ncbi:MAG: tripartite tricarboxylate transporter substrate-binding protein, partial [Roseimicrobium sp.]
LTVAMGGVRDGALRALAVTSAVRLPQLPDVPTIGESGFPGYDMSEWSGIWGPAGLAPGTVLRVQAAVAAALSDATARNRLATMGAVPVGNAAESFKTELAQERSVFAALVRDARITLD